MKNIKVYKMDEYDWVATDKSFDETVEWYGKLSEPMDEEQIEDISECDISTEGFWKNIYSDIELEEYNANKHGEPKDGDRYSTYYGNCEWTIYERFLKDYTGTYPFVIATTEY